MAILVLRWLKCLKKLGQFQPMFSSATTGVILLAIRILKTTMMVNLIILEMLMGC
nr:MAG TPA: hypothetical protein [Caudoviricetes sp.]